MVLAETKRLAPVPSPLRSLHDRACAPHHRWHNYLDPRLNLNEGSEEEDARIIEAVKIHGTRWSVIRWMLTGPDGVRTAAWAKVATSQRAKYSKIGDIPAAGLLAARPHTTPPRSIQLLQRPAAPRGPYLGLVERNGPIATKLCLLQRCGRLLTLFGRPGSENFLKNRYYSIMRSR